MELATSPRTGRWQRVAASGLALASLLVFAAPSQGGTATVRATDNKSWAPGKISVAKGTKVVWKNPSGDDHDFTSYSGKWTKSASLAEGQSTSFKFRKVGTYKYRCTRHSEMVGTKCEGMCGSVQVR
jgi:plastocyanin